jgi:hypothetical protein
LNSSFNNLPLRHLVDGGLSTGCKILSMVHRVLRGLPVDRLSLSKTRSWPSGRYLTLIFHGTCGSSHGVGQPLNAVLDQDPQMTKIDPPPKGARGPPGDLPSAPENPVILVMVIGPSLFKLTGALRACPCRAWKVKLGPPQGVPVCLCRPRRPKRFPLEDW